MAHTQIDGMVVVAKLKRGLLGGAVYRDVAIRKDDGDVRRLGTIMVLSDMKPAMVPGSRGRFYHYDVLGTKGVYGFRPLGGRAHARFPYRWEIMMLGIGILNLLVSFGWLMIEGRIAFLSTIFGLLGLVMGTVFVATRIAAMRAYRADDPRIASAAELRAARA